MDRLVSLKTVIDTMNDWLANSTDDLDNLYERIKAIPPAEPQVLPIANIHFDEDKMREVCKEVAENIVVEYDFKGKTNGEVIKMIFPDNPIDEFVHDVNMREGVYVKANFEKEWWNSPYKGEQDDNNNN